MFNFLKKRWWVVLLLILVIGGAVWYFSRPKKSESTAIHATKQTITQTLEVSGSVDAGEKIDIPYGLGRISWVGVKEGQTIKKWQTLATMDTRTLQKQQQQDLNIHGKAVRQRDQTLDNMDYYTDATLTDDEKRAAESANLDIANSALTVEIRDITIKQAVISSPIEGIITRLDLPYGGVNAGAADYIQIVNPKTIYFTAVVDETDISTIKEGQAVKINLDAYPENTLSSTVAKIEFAPSTSKNGGTGYKVHFPLPLDNATLQYRLGMNGTATIIIDEKNNVLTLPTDSLISREGKTYVEVQEGKNTAQKEITTGLETDDTAEIISGINEQTVVILPQAVETK